MHARVCREIPSFPDWLWLACMCVFSLLFILFFLFRDIDTSVTQFAICSAIKAFQCFPHVIQTFHSTLHANITSSISLTLFLQISLQIDLSLMLPVSRTEAPSTGRLRLCLSPRKQLLAFTPLCQAMCICNNFNWNRNWLTEWSTSASLAILGFDLAIPNYWRPPSATEWWNPSDSSNR